MIRVWGADISLNHGAIVELENTSRNMWERSGLIYYTDIVGAAEKSFEHGVRMPDYGKEKDAHQRALERMAWVEKLVIGALQRGAPDYIGIEDYAFDQTQGAHQLGEMGSIVKMLFFRRSIPLRIQHIDTIKLFAAGDAKASKDDVVDAVLANWREDFTVFNPPPAKKSGKPNTRTGEDVADAYTIARMVAAEVDLRRGHLLMSDLPEHQIRAFNRITKSQPINILGRDWTRRKESQVNGALRSRSGKR